MTAALAQQDDQEAQVWTPENIAGIRHLCEISHLNFTRFFFKVRDGSPFIVSPHHELICDVLDRVIDGEIKRLIINVPPGYTKTELAVINFVARGLAINPRAKFMHASYSSDLALHNSGQTKDVIQSEEFQRFWPMELRSDSKGKKAWYNKQGGGMYAAGAGGQLTGFRAGRSDGEDKELFSGALIIDDPIKPDDAFSDGEREKINRRFTNTYKSRLMHDDIPIIVIMQRIHEDDPTGFLLSGGSGDEWHHLCLPVEIPIPEEKNDYPAEWSSGIEIPHNLTPGPLWPYKHNKKQIAILKNDDYTFNSQYNQDPTPAGGGIFKDHWWDYYTEIPKLKAIVIYGDTATKKQKRNDFNVFLLAGLGYDNKLYILDVFRQKLETPEMVKEARKFWNKHKKVHGHNRPGATTMKVEDKSSGIFLVQLFKREGIPIQAIPRNDDKVQRAVNVAPEFAEKKVLLPEGPTAYTNAAWVPGFKLEFSKMTLSNTQKNDDQIDPTIDAVEDLLIGKGHNIYAGL